MALAYVLFWLAAAAHAQCDFCPGDLSAGRCEIYDPVCEGQPSDYETGPCSGNGCNFTHNCRIPTVSGPSLEVLPEAGGTYTARLSLEVHAPWNDWAASANPNGTLDMLWFNTASVPSLCSTGFVTSLCDYLDSDDTRSYLERTGLSCGGAPYSFGVFSFRAQVCGGGCLCEQFPTLCPCWRKVDHNNLSFTVTAADLGCPVPPKDPCDDCKACKLAGPGRGNVGGGGGRAAPADSGPGALLRYAAGGAGHPDFPGTPAWNETLGTGWSHDYAERIVPDPDESHVWLITKTATFREFSGLSGGIYTTVSPSDEKRRLHRTATGWELRELDGMIHEFDQDGLWLETRDRNGNAKVASYSAGRLDSVAFPDGRTEAFAYHPDGKLASITETGAGGAAGRTWEYTWVGHDLVRLDRPDGTAWEFFYEDAAHPGSMTRMELVGTDGSRRVETAWEYDARGNVIRLWRGDASFSGPGAVEKWAFSFDNPVRPTVTTVTDPLGKVATYAVGRDSVSDKVRISAISGDCPTCGLGPNVQLFYEDPTNPLRPTRTIDGRGTENLFIYDANGLLLSRTEATGQPVERTTDWTYDSTYPSHPLSMEVPSTSGGASTRKTLYSYDGAGNRIEETLEGAEAGGSFSHTTVTTYNAAGQPLAVDPPGHGTNDQTTFTYDPLRGNLIPLSRIDPLIGATTLEHDPFNRLTSVTDPNGVETVTAYDALNRVTSVTRKGATAAEDLVTVYQYNAFGDLFRTILPRGNVIEYGYDAAGRLTSIERKPDASSPGERTLYALDSAGNRIQEELQRWDGAAWVTESSTGYVYATRCHLEKVVHPDGSVTEYSYDCDGNLERVWDANHPRATNPQPTQLYAYDALNRLTSVTQPWTGAGGGTAATTYGYDVQDHLTSVTDAEGNTTTYTYSDRDLMTRQVSPASGTTTYLYDEHGNLTAETDARNVTVARTFDVLDRLTAVTYPDSSLNVAQTYDDPAVPFSKGRLTRIARPGSAVDYRYDRFGRLLQDGALGFTWDANGNAATLVYPGDVTAVYTYDFADRPATLLARRPGRPDQPLATSAGYLPSGPLSSLTLGNGLLETRGFDDRYFPASLSLTGISQLLAWSYSTDDVGNILSIADTLTPASSRTYGYQDVHYFLTRGDGPWGLRSWTYDKIGNRLTETRGAATDTYTYLPSSTGGRSPILSQIQLGAGGTQTYQFGPAGHLERVALGASSTVYRSDVAGRLSALENPGSPSGSTFRYDGRDYLTQAAAGSLPFQNGFETGDLCGWSAAVGASSAPTCPVQPTVQPTYSSEGLLHGLQRNTAPERSLVFHFAGRPVAQLDLTGGNEIWTFLTTDHLGTPLAATGPGGALLWQGGFEPFGADWSGAAGAGMFLRFPGQWAEAAFGSGLYYNVHRWYEPGTGRYGRPDPLETRGDANPFAYAYVNPITIFDLLGLKSRTCCTPIDPRAGLRTFKHCFIEVQDDNGTSKAYSLHGMGTPSREWGGPFGCTFENDLFDLDAIGKPATECGPWSDDCWTDDCVRRAYESYPKASPYKLRGPNSNTFAGSVTRTCGIVPPAVAGTWRTPGWSDNRPSGIYWPGPRGMYPMSCPERR